jgi:hypothetical protein
MISTLRAYFLTRLLREKILLLGFILIGTVWWFSSTATRAARFWREQRATTSELRVQQQWLNNRVAIEDAAKKAATQLVPAKTLDRTRLNAAVNQAASEVGLKNGGTSNASSETIGQFTIHSLVYQVAGADYDTLLKFYLKINQQAPYIGIESFLLFPTNPNDTSKFTLNLKISSVEIPQ